MRFLSPYSGLKVCVVKDQILIAQDGKLSGQSVPGKYVVFKESPEALQVVSKNGMVFKSILEVKKETVIARLFEIAEETVAKGYSPTFFVHPDDDPSNVNKVVEANFEEKEEVEVDKNEAAKAEKARIATEAEVKYKDESKDESKDVLSEEDLMEEEGEMVEVEEFNLNKMNGKQLNKFAQDNYGVNIDKIKKLDDKRKEIERLYKEQEEEGEGEE